MRLIRLVLLVAALGGVVLVARMLLGDRPTPASLDAWPPVPRKPAPAAPAA